jgi:hypothetical protein
MTRTLCLALLVALAPFLARPAHAQAPSPSDTVPPPPPDDEESDATPPPAEAQPPPQAPDRPAFEERLAPYGRWVDTPEYGRVWIPATSSPDWQPYSEGRWVYTEWGWSFVSDVPWGWAVFHYGRWGWRAGFGWFWVPGFVWAPAWVSWRWSGGHVCWSPYAPAGFFYGRRWPGWVVVPRAHFTHPIGREMIPRAHVAPIVRAARPGPSFAAPARRGAFGPPRAWVRPFRGRRH